MRQTVKVQYSFLSIGAVSTIQFPEVSLTPDTPPPLLTPYLCCPGNLLMTQQLVTISSDLLRSSLLAPEPRSWLLGLGFRWRLSRQCLACCWLDRQCCEGGGSVLLWLVWTLQPPVGGVTRLCPPLPAAPLPTPHTRSALHHSTPGGDSHFYTHKLRDTDIWHYKYLSNNKTSDIMCIRHNTQDEEYVFQVLKPSYMHHTVLYW